MMGRSTIILSFMGMGPTWSESKLHRQDGETYRNGTQGNALVSAEVLPNRDSTLFAEFLGGSGKEGNWMDAVDSSIPN